MSKPKKTGKRLEKMKFEKQIESEKSQCLHENSECLKFCANMQFLNSSNLHVKILYLYFMIKISFVVLSSAEKLRKNLKLFL